MQEDSIVPYALRGMEVVLFDLDGTLVDESGLPAAVRGACEAVASATGLRPNDLLAANTRVWEHLWPEVHEEWMLGALDVGALAECGVTDEAAVQLAVRTHRELESAAHRVFPEAVAVLDALRERGLRVGLVTNGAAAVQRAKLDVLGLTARFDPLVISSEVGVMKPDAGIFEHAVVQAGSGPERTAMVGDHLWHDVEGAMSAGLRGIWVDRCDAQPRDDWPRPDAVLADLAGLVDD